MFCVVKIKQGSSVWIADAPLRLGGQPYEISLDDFKSKFNCTYTESLWAAHMSFAQAGSGADSLEDRLKQRLKRPLFDQLIVCHINDRVGYGLFTRAPIRRGDIIITYAGVLMDEDRQPDSSYHMHYADLPGERSHVIDAKHCGGLARFIQHSMTNTDKWLDHNAKLELDPAYMQESKRIDDDEFISLSAAEAEVRETRGSYEEIKARLFREQPHGVFLQEHATTKFLTARAKEQVVCANLVLRSAWLGGFTGGTLVKFFQAIRDIEEGEQLLFDYMYTTLVEQGSYPELFTKDGGILPHDQYERSQIYVPFKSVITEVKPVTPYPRDVFLTQHVKRCTPIDVLPGISMFWIRKQFILANALDEKFGPQKANTIVYHLRKILGQKVDSVEIFYADPTSHEEMGADAYRANVVITAKEGEGFEQLYAAISGYFAKVAEEKGKPVTTYCRSSPDTGEIILLDVNTHVDIMREFLLQLPRISREVAEEVLPMSAILGGAAAGRSIWRGGAAGGGI